MKTFTHYQYTYMKSQTHVGAFWCHLLIKATKTEFHLLMKSLHYEHQHLSRKQFFLNTDFFILEDVEGLYSIQKFLKMKTIPFDNPHNIFLQMLHTELKCSQ